MKKLVCFILLLVLATSIIGCGNNGDEGGKFYRITFRQKPYADIVVTVDEGGSLSYDKLPTIRPKAGYNVAWQTTEFENVTEDIVVEAVYQAKNYTVEYNTNGGTAITETTNVTFDSMYDLLKDTNRNDEDLFFGGWYYDGKLVGNTGIWNIDAGSPIVLNARWNYKVTFIAQFPGYEDVIPPNVYHVFVEVGKSLKKENAPIVPHLDGYVGYWDIEDYSQVTESRTIEAKYETVWGSGFH